MFCCERQGFVFLGQSPLGWERDPKGGTDWGLTEEGQVQVVTDEAGDQGRRSRL